MQIGIIGTGKMASGLGQRWARYGHSVLFGSRTPEKACTLATQVGMAARGGSYAEATAFGEAVLLAIPYVAVPEALASMEPVDGKVLIDCTNPLTPGDGAELTIGYTTSAGEEIARLAPGGRVVKAFNAVFSRVVHTSPVYDSQRASIFYCGDDAAAKDAVDRLIRHAGFEPVDAGPLRMARTLEPLAVLLIEIGYAQHRGRYLAIKLLHSSTAPLPTRISLG